MKVKCNTWLTTGALVAMMLAAAQGTLAQYPAKTQNPPPANNQNPPPATSTDKTKTPPDNSLKLDDPNAAPVNAEEDAAFKALSDPANDQAKRIELGEAFLQKYPTSPYRSPVYGTLVMAYVQSGQVQKMEEVADKEIALNPNDVQVLGVGGQTLPRAMNSKPPEPNK